MFKSSPLFGIGPSHFLVNLPAYISTTDTVFFLQPVHSIYFLALSEWGALGLAAVLIVVYLAFRSISFSYTPLKKYLFILLVTLLIIGLFDHYLFTLQQVQMLLAFSLGFIYASTASTFSFKNVKKYPKAKSSGKRKKFKK
jgi:O-antigen ligase